MARYRKRPVEIEAVRWTGENWSEIVAAFQPFRGEVVWDPDSHGLLIATREGRMHCSVGDWLIRGVKGEFYPCKPDIFELTYELAEEADSDLARRVSRTSLRLAPRSPASLVGEPICSD